MYIWQVRPIPFVYRLQNDIRVYMRSSEQEGRDGQGTNITLTFTLQSLLVSTGYVTNCGRFRHRVCGASWTYTQVNTIHTVNSDTRVCVWAKVG